jgi:hypothetical protein
LWYNILQEKKSELNHPMFRIRPSSAWAISLAFWFVSNLRSIFISHQSGGLQTSHTLVSLEKSKHRSISPKILLSNEMASEYLTNNTEPAVALNGIIKGFHQPEPRSMLFVHVGKTGGETVKGLLRVTCDVKQTRTSKMDCTNKLEARNETQLSKRTQAYFHCDKILPRQVSVDSITSFLFSLRNPVDRVESWFRYMKPTNCLGGKYYHSPPCRTKRARVGWAFDFFHLCFPDVEDFAKGLWHPAVAATITTTGKSCTDLAWMALTARAPAGPSSHMYFNHRYYATNTTQAYPNKEVLVVRTEFLWKDLQGIELLLGGGEIVQSQWNNQVSTKYKKYDQLSQAGAQLLCCAMTDEITAYINILNKAVNLNMEARSHSFAYLLRRCGVESFQKLEETCSPLSFRFLF